MCFHHHRQGRLICYFGQDQTALLLRVIQIRIWVSPGQFINQI